MQKGIKTPIKEKLVSFFIWFSLQIFLQSVLSGFFKSGQLHTYFYNFDCWFLMTLLSVLADAKPARLLDITSQAA